MLLFATVSSEDVAEVMSITIKLINKHHMEQQDTSSELVGAVILTVLIIWAIVGIVHWLS